MFVIKPDTLGRLGQRITLLLRQVAIRLFKTLSTERQLAHAGHTQTIKAVGVVDQSRIPPLPDSRNDVSDTLLNLVIGYPLPSQQGVETSIEVSLGSGKPRHIDGCSWCLAHGRSCLYLLSALVGRASFAGAALFHRPGQACDQRFELRMLHGHGRLVDHQTCADGGDQLAG